MESNLKHLITQIHLIFKNTLLRCLKIILCCIWLILGYHNSISQDISEWKEAISNGSDVEKLENAWELFKYYRLKNRDSARYYADYFNSKARSLSDTLNMIKSYNALGYLERENGDYINSISFYEKGLHLAQMAEFNEQIKFLMNNLALVHTYYGNYDKSLDYHFQSLNIREKEGDLKGIATAYNNIGLVYYQIDDDEKALNYYLKSLNIRKENNLQEGTENVLINLGLVYTSLERYDEALTVYEEVLKTCKEDCGEQFILDANVGSGFVFFQMKRYEEAIEPFEKSLEIAEKINSKKDLITANFYLAEIYFRTDSLAVAFNYVNKASEIVYETDFQTWKMQIDNLYAEMFEAQGNFERAYFHENRYSTLRDSIFNEELIKNLANIQLDYQEAQTQEIIAGKDTQIKRRTQINLMLGGITILISALLFILYKNIQLKKKANKRLAEANDIIEHQNKELTNVNAVLEDRVKERTKELKKTNEALKKSNEELDNFIYKTSHDIRGPLATLMGVCNIAQIDVKDEKALDYFDKLSLTATRLNEILSKLLTINQINNTALQPQKIYVAELVENLAVEQIMSFKNPKVEINVDIEDGLNLTSDLELLRVIYGNLINNAIKFRDTSDRRDSFINISASKTTNSIELNITDNGIGINETETEKIFEVFSKATDIADSSGIGLYLVKLAVEKLSGSISFEESEDGYTVFKVILPA